MWNENANTIAVVAKNRSRDGTCGENLKPGLKLCAKIPIVIEGVGKHPN